MFGRTLLSLRRYVSLTGSEMLRWFLLFCSLGLTTAKLTGESETDVDQGQDWDIFDINEGAGLDLLEGDIDQDEESVRNTILGEEYRWPKTIPYYLEESLEMNAKGVILKAFEQYRLKTCIDFTPWRGEQNYLSVFKGSGCYSSVGNQRVGKQRLSIGNNCDRLGTVEHEFLHALGFWHEQSRADRDDYVNIMWDQIEPGKEHNFKSRDDSESSALGIPYDYGSVMHYSKTSFNIGSKATIIPRIPEFSDVIGQRMGFSQNDLAKLSLLYNCTKSSSFVEKCDFEEENVCGMIITSDQNQWERRSSVIGDVQYDFTNMGECKGKGFFMHFSSSSSRPGDRALLQSRWVYPKPGVQCLTFFLYNTAAADDVLNIWVREQDPNGKMKLFKSIFGGGTGSWELHNINLEVTQKSRVVFEAIRGNLPSKGGFSLDDINMASTKCPQHIWHIRNMTKLLNSTKPGTKTYSPRYLSAEGYSFQVGVYLNGRSDRPGYVGVYVHLTSGPNDHRLQWPCAWQQVTVVLMDQQSDIRQQMNNHRMFTTDPEKVSSDGELYWDHPSKVGSKVTAADGTTYYRGPGYGTSSFLTHLRMKSRKFIKGDDAYFLFSMEDISELLAPQPVSKSAEDLVPPDHSQVPALITGVTGVMVIVVTLIIGTIVWRIKRRRGNTEQDMPPYEDHLDKDLPTLTQL